MKKPNVVVILTDDQGYGDLSCMGSTDFRTPHFDHLAETGIRFSSFYANSPVCSPSRASLLTGCYPRKTGCVNILAGRRNLPGMDPDINTIPKELKKHGYSTSIFGKWHLGSAEEIKPQNQGFDRSLVFYAGNIDYYSSVFYYGFTRNVLPIHDMWENGVETNAYSGRYFTEVITEKVCNEITRAHEADEPFFVYAAYNAPHFPMQAPDKYMNRFKGMSPDRQVMCAMISAVDDGVGEITATLDRLGIREDTLVVFHSDNGPERSDRCWLDGKRDYYYGGSTGGLRGEKASLFEGGIRVPAIISWPGTLPCGVVNDDMVSSFNIFPTICHAMGLDETKMGFDGSNILEYLQGKEENPNKEIFFEMPDAAKIVATGDPGFHQYGVRKGDWKLIEHPREIDLQGKNIPYFLCNVREDMAESENVVDKYPEKFEELRKDLEDWKASLPPYDPEKYRWFCFEII